MVSLSLPNSLIIVFDLYVAHQFDDMFKLLERLISSHQVLKMVLKAKNKSPNAGSNC